ncbi:hypothetical protein ACU4GD_32180 [Cupriavidus basilensis]
MVANIKSDAKQRARTRQITLTVPALNEAATGPRDSRSWHALHRAHLSYAGAADGRPAMPLDRILPPNFDDTRSEATQHPGARCMVGPALCGDLP